jgi:hypothetical protein
LKRMPEFFLQVEYVGSSLPLRSIIGWLTFIEHYIKEISEIWHNFKTTWLAVIPRAHGKESGYFRLPLSKPPTP